MKKFYQLFLMIISCLSLVVLLIYKSENTRLKYLLEAVNFFGRKDASDLANLVQVTSADQFYDASLPMPVWWAIGVDFHAYAAYWVRNELVAEGDAFAIVVGRQGAIINYKCSLKFENGTVLKGRFRFQRVDSTDSEKDFDTYFFYCKLSRNSSTPESVTFLEANARAGQEMRLNHIKLISPMAGTQNNRDNNVVCVDLVKPGSNTDETNKNLLQFFLHHKLVGLRHFLVYNGDIISRKLHHLLQKNGFSVHYFPFNFPFITNSSEGIRQVVEIDCIIRNTFKARYSLLLKANEFFYPETKLGANHSILHSLDKYSGEVTRFEIPSFAVCLNRRKNFLMDNNLYDPETQLPKLFIYRTQGSSLTTSSTRFEALALLKNLSVTVSLSKALAHRYIECLRVGKDGLRDWRIPLREDFIQHFKTLRYEISSMVKDFK